VEIPVTRRVALIHASRASVEPVAQYYTKHAPEFDYANLLDDGAMQVLDAAADQSVAFRRLGAMERTAQQEYQASAARDGEVRNRRTVAEGNDPVGGRDLKQATVRGEQAVEARTFPDYRNRRKFCAGRRNAQWRREARRKGR
jgi:hypothetical protein